MQNICGWSVDRLHKAVTKASESSLADSSVLHPVLGSGLILAVGGSIWMARRLAQEKRTLENRIIELESDLRHEKSNIDELPKLRNTLNDTKEELRKLQRTIDDLQTQNTDLANTNKEVRKQLISLTDAFTEEYSTNQKYQEECLLDDINKRKRRLR